MNTVGPCECDCAVWGDHHPDLCERAASTVRRSRPRSTFPVDVCGPCGAVWDQRMVGRVVATVEAE